MQWKSVNRSSVICWKIQRPIICVQLDITKSVVDNYGSCCDYPEANWAASFENAMHAFMPFLKMTLSSIAAIVVVASLQWPWSSLRLRQVAEKRFDPGSALHRTLQHHAVWTTDSSLDRDIINDIGIQATIDKKNKCIKNTNIGLSIIDNISEFKSMIIVKAAY